MQRLLEGGAKVDQRNGVGATALMFARRLAEQQGNDEMIKLLDKRATR